MRIIQRIQQLLLWRKQHFCILAFLFCITPILASAQQWRTLGNLRDARNYFEAQPISASEALVIGGYLNGTHPLNGTPSGSCEIIDLTNRRILPAAAMHVAHAETVSLLAKDSTIVVVSGMSNGGELTGIVEAFSLQTRQWRILGELLLPRRQHTAVFINADEILVIGGRISNSNVVGDCEIFNIRTGKSRTTGSLPTGVCIGSAGVASNGDIVMIGGNGRGFGAQHSRGVFAFDRSKEQWSVASILPENLAATTLLTMPNGELTIFYGHNGDDPQRGWLASNTVYRETNAVFRAVVTSAEPRYWTCAAAWNQDSVLVLGGFESASFSPRPLTTTEWFHTRTNALAAGPRLTTQRAYAKALSFPHIDRCTNELLPRIIAISGFDSWSSATSSVEILERTEAPSPGGKSRPYQPFAAFPQPAREVVNVAFPTHFVHQQASLQAASQQVFENNGGRAGTQKLPYSLVNTRGQAVQQGVLSAERIQSTNQYIVGLDVSGLPVGMYVLTLSDAPCGSIPIVVQR